MKCSSLYYTLNEFWQPVKPKSFQDLEHYCQEVPPCSFLGSPSPRTMKVWFSFTYHRLILAVLALNINGIVQYILLHARLLSFYIVFLRFIHIVECISRIIVFFFFWVILYWLSISTYLSNFPLMGMTKATKNFLEWVFCGHKFWFPVDNYSFFYLKIFCNKKFLLDWIWWYRIIKWKFSLESLKEWD